MSRSLQLSRTGNIMTKIINIDALREETPFILVVDGVEHKMKAPSIQDFIENTEMVEKLGVNPSLKDEFNVAVKAIKRAFPTIDEAVIRSWEIKTVEKLFAIARGDEAVAEKMDEEGNVEPKS